MNLVNPFAFKGISEADVLASRRKNGSNILGEKSQGSFISSVKEAVVEPMFLLLVACTVIYFVLGEFSEAWFMLGAILLVSTISVFQDNRSRKALNALKEFTQPHATVIRNDQLTKVVSGDLVVGDYVVASEGELIPADGVLRQISDFSVNESILTGEAFSISKTLDGDDNKVYSGTLVQSGQSVFEITAVGKATRLGQIGTSIEAIAVEKTPLQQQIAAFVKSMAVIGVCIFLLIWLINYLRYGDVLNSLLKGLTIAMSVLPEEIPVAFATFTALGAWRLMKRGIIVKQTSTVEALGSATILCTDKTGTITENKMELSKVYDLATDRTYTSADWAAKAALDVITAAMWSSETVPFDPMEQALHNIYGQLAAEDKRPDYKMVHEYPLSGKPPMMTHLFEDAAGHKIIACKGAPEAILNISGISPEQKAKVNAVVAAYAKDGLRVLAVGKIEFKDDNYPETQQEFKADFMGLVGFYDPPKKGIDKVFKSLGDAGILVKIITGDNAETATAIARQAGFIGYEKVINSAELLAMDDASFDTAVMHNNIFARMFPDLKLRIIESLKKQRQIVGMTGDGVNDGPALKAAHIGIAMGKRGSEIARQASSLILTDDDFGKMVDAVAMGRKIYANLKKAIQYIISIHIPIILTVAIPSILGWEFPVIFSPIHVIFLELVMGPTCSVVYENEPLEANGMLQPPRTMGSTFFSIRELTISIFQGLGITIGILLMYRFAVHLGYSETHTRSLVFTSLIFANVFLSLVNRSFYYSVWSTLRYRNNLFPAMIGLTLGLLALLMYVPLFAVFFKLEPLNIAELCSCTLVALASVIGFEVFKWGKRRGVGF